MTLHIANGNHTNISVMSIFMKTVLKTIMKSHAPTLQSHMLYTISENQTVFLYFFYSLIFDLSVCSNGKNGKYKRTNSGEIERRRKGLSRGTNMAPQGRPLKYSFIPESAPRGHII